MQNNYSLSDIYRYGKDGDIFQVTRCSSTNYIGYQVRVEMDTSDSDHSYKCLVEADSPRGTDNAKYLVTHYGCLGTADFFLTNDYEQVDLLDVFTRLREGYPVYVRDGGLCCYSQITNFTDFEDMHIEDFDDLMTKEFFVRKYVKQSMSRLATMSRFAEPEEVEPEELDTCCYCGEPLVEGQEVTKFDEDYYCDDFCCHLQNDIKTITLGDE